jgi:hypothetical protein
MSSTNAHLDRLKAIAAKSAQRITSKNHWRGEVDLLASRLDTWLGQNIALAFRDHDKNIDARVMRNSGGPADAAERRMKNDQPAPIEIETQNIVFRIDIATQDNSSLFLVSGFSIALDRNEEGRFHMWAGNFMRIDDRQVTLGIEYYSAPLGSAEAENVISNATDYLRSRYDAAHKTFADAALHAV